jgi:hypothetical protein
MFDLRYLKEDAFEAFKLNLYKLSAYQSIKGLEFKAK